MRSRANIALALARTWTEKAISISDTNRSTQRIISVAYLFVIGNMENFIPSVFGGANMSSKMRKKVSYMYKTANIFREPTAARNFGGIGFCFLKLVVTSILQKYPFNMPRNNPRNQ